MPTGKIRPKQFNQVDGVEDDLLVVTPSGSDPNSESPEFRGEVVEILDNGVSLGKFKSLNFTTGGTGLGFNGSLNIFRTGATGTTGPQGSQGPQGGVGAVGAVGAQGAQGLAGQGYNAGVSLGFNRTISINGIFVTVINTGTNWYNVDADTGWRDSAIGYAGININSITGAGTNLMTVSCSEVVGLTGGRAARVSLYASRA